MFGENARDIVAICVEALDKNLPVFAADLVFLDKLRQRADVRLRQDDLADIVELLLCVPGLRHFAHQG